MLRSRALRRIGFAALVVAAAGGEPRPAERAVRQRHSRGARDADTAAARSPRRVSDGRSAANPRVGGHARHLASLEHRVPAERRLARDADPRRLARRAQRRARSRARRRCTRGQTAAPLGAARGHAASALRRQPIRLSDVSQRPRRTTKARSRSRAAAGTAKRCATFATCS